MFILEKTKCLHFHFPTTKITHHQAHPKWLHWSTAETSIFLKKQSESGILLPLRFSIPARLWIHTTFCRRNFKVDSVKIWQGKLTEKLPYQILRDLALLQVAPPSFTHLNDYAITLCLINLTFFCWTKHRLSHFNHQIVFIDFFHIIKTCWSQPTISVKT